MRSLFRRGRVGIIALVTGGVAAFACSSSEQNASTAEGSGGLGQLGSGGAGASSGSPAAGSGGGGGPSAGGAAPAGSVCTQASECGSGKCSGGLCEPSGPLPNSTCVTGPDCASGVCVSGACQIPQGTTGPGGPGKCAPGSLGCPCQPADKCKAGLSCTGGTCCDSKSGSCTPKGGGPMGTGGTSGNPGTAAACKPGVVGAVITECGYPYASSNALTSVVFNESEVLAAIVPSGGYPFATLQLFYDDEHAMTLGVRETVINGVSTEYPVSPLTSNPQVVSSPQTGTNHITGQQAGVDPSGRPMWPALFVTDITVDANAVSGDWQWGGAAVNPTYVAGTWKGAVRTVDASGATITPDADPPRNNLDYGNGHTAPAGAITKTEGYSTEVRWDLRLEPGHNYRFQVMVHDGDQNKVGGDTGEACVTFCAGDSCPAGVSACTSSAECTNGDACSSGCCIPPPPPPPPPTDGGTCPPNWQTYLQTEGRAICTPPPTDGGCPQGYVLTIRGNQQFCTPVEIR